MRRYGEPHPPGVANRSGSVSMQQSTLERAITIAPVGLEADLVVPPDAAGIVAFAHGSGSSRHRPRNRFVARVLQQGGLGTLLLDLLTREEEEIDLRTDRMSTRLNYSHVALYR